MQSSTDSVTVNNINDESLNINIAAQASSNYIANNLFNTENNGLKTAIEQFVWSIGFIYIRDKDNLQVLQASIDQAITNYWNFNTIYRINEFRDEEKENEANNNSNSNINNNNDVQTDIDSVPTVPSLNVNTQAVNGLNNNDNKEASDDETAASTDTSIDMPSLEHIPIRNTDMNINWYHNHTNNTRYLPANELNQNHTEYNNDNDSWQQ